MSLVDASPGAELWAWFNANGKTDDEIDAHWKQLSGVLSGLFCASLSFVDNSNTIRPQYAFRPTFTSSESSQGLNSAKYKIRYATLPREIVCTENLTPWKKMLPANHREGLLSLIRSGNIHSTNYHSLGVHIRRLSTPNSKSKTERTNVLEVKQTVNLVFDKRIVTESQDWSLRRLFGLGLNGASVMASSSKVYIDYAGQDFILTPDPTTKIISQRGGITTHLAMYDVKGEFNDQMFNIAAIYGKKDDWVQIFQSPPLFAKRFLLGIGQEQGKILTKITNTHWSPLNLILQENLPWFVPVYLHTLRIKVDKTGQQIEPITINYIPGRLRERPTQLEVAFKIPARSTVDVTIEFDYVFLKWLEYPPDANHGHYIGSAIIMGQLPIGRNYTAAPVDARLFSDSFNATRSYGYIVNIRTESLLITLPTPDFSMPYNVICLTCTVVALAFGPIHNLATKKLTFGKKDETTEKSKSLLQRIKGLFSKEEKVKEN